MKSTLALLLPAALLSGCGPLTQPLLGAVTTHAGLGKDPRIGSFDEATKVARECCPKREFPAKGIVAA